MINKSINWSAMEKLFFVFSGLLSQAASEPIKFQDDASTISLSFNDDNPLYLLPFEIRENLTTEYYGMFQL